MRGLNKFFCLTSSTRQICTVSTANLNDLINTFIQNNYIREARKLFDENPTSRNLVSWNTMITGYVKNDQFRHAKDLFDQMPVKDDVSWNIMLSGFQKTRNTDGLYRCFLEMGRLGVRPNDYTLSTVLSAVLNTAYDVLVQQIHALAVCLALNLSGFVGSTLMKWYASVGNKEDLGRAFDEILVKEVTPWNALIFGYMKLGSMAEAQRAFDLMPERNIVSWTTLVDGYIRNQRIDKARSIFNKMDERNVVSWTVMTRGYVQNLRFLDAFRLFLLMSNSGIRPNHYTFSSMLDACAGCSSILMGQQVHGSIFKSGIRDDVILSTSIVDMYAKCGDMDAAYKVFESILNKNVASWNSIIGGYARHGLATRALEVFERMKAAGFRPDNITFVNVLSACGHGGLVEIGEWHFDTMLAQYGILAELEHYACMVDLYGKAGQLDKAETLIKEMPLEPDVVVWGALLSACGLHSNLELGEFAAERIREQKSDHPASYSILSKIHGEKGVWSDVIELRNMMKERQIRKQKASSWV
ncbi:Pentatricopeptide repeat-containing protein [Quillaja saponaria]|uniref:Pentatricopeptide repeat-containing protein n=1 Tax=Quillaja saponaria TaxID=32244 RepID=A0AAD7Q1W4_QUISA|nr:Pentatricopeptide repeat-containing protein [Quillaja saponaria]KAJ7973097.1 Pentatricopeptide repeat-containing protein [Quillaja saponaria]